MLKRIRSLLGLKGGRTAGQTDVAGDPVAPPTPPSRATTHAAPAQPAVHHGPRVAHQPIAKSDLDPDAVKIVQRLTRFDHSAFLVGGCVRDLLLDLRPKDFDVGTSATPRQIKRLFRNSRIIGRRFRLAHIYFQSGKIIEVATFRALDVPDGPPDDSEEQDLLIRDDNVFGTVEEDALRRDFTINSLFYDINNETVLDHADGLGDLRRRVIRTIGDPEVRFREDPIRILRAIKFAARLNFTIEPATLAALCRTRSEIPKAAAPRILEEINRFCRQGAARRSFELLRDTDVFGTVVPEIAAHYAVDSPGWDILLAVLGRIDEQPAQDAGVRTGEILAALLLWPLSERTGWIEDGAVRSLHGLDARGPIDEILRPIALRLRVPRRDQEQCRDILISLLRMVPARRARSGGRSALRRASLPEAMRALEVLAGRFGGAFTEALESWQRTDHEPQPRPAHREQPRVAEGAEPAERGAAGRSPRRGRRRRGRGKGEAAADRPAAPERAPVQQDLPPPWDDRYFFAALPSVPELGGDEDGTGNRYGAVTPAAAPAAADPGPPPSSPERAEGAEPGATPKPKRRRRPRRRRRKPDGSEPAAAPGSQAADEDAADEEPEDRPKGFEIH